MTPIDAGPEGDARVAEVVMGWELGTRRHDNGVWASKDGHVWRRLLCFTDDNSAAHEVLAKMREMGWWVGYTWNEQGHFLTLKRWKAEPNRVGGKIGQWAESGWCPTFALAACRAALAAKEGE